MTPLQSWKTGPIASPPTTRLPKWNVLRESRALANLRARSLTLIGQAFRKLDYMLSCDPITRVFTDHRNLLSDFNPVSMEPSLGRHKVLKVVRWALFLSAFMYSIEYVHGDVNTWSDIMTRWMRGYRKEPRHPAESHPLYRSAE